MKNNFKKYILLLVLTASISLTDCTKNLANAKTIIKTPTAKTQTSNKISKKTPITKKKATKTIKKQNKIKKTRTKTKQNGDISDKIQISEVFPDPSGTDHDKEWLELYNSSSKNINLGNWQIIVSDTQNSNKKPKISILSNSLSLYPNSLLTLSDNQLKISLPNQNSKIELKDPVGKTIDSISYEKAETDSSLSRIKVINGKQSKTIDNWGKISKNTPNPIFYEIFGTILAKTETSDKNLANSIEILTTNKQTLKVSIPKNKRFENIDLLLQANTMVDAMITKNTNNNYELMNFEIKNDTQKTNPKNKTKENWPYYLLIFASGTIFLLHKLFKLHSIKDKLSNISTG